MSKLKPFDLQRALAGDKVVTREGREVVQIFHADKVDTTSHPVIAVVEGEIFRFTKDGKYVSDKFNSIRDLFMAPKTVKIERWVNVYPDCNGDCWHTKEDADLCATQDRIACVHLTGEYEC